MAVYFLRHGQCKANLEKVFAGQGDDSELTGLGFEQAALAGDTLAPLNIVRIISSNLIRASHTAETAGAKIGFEPKDIVIDERLAEYDLGSLTGRPRYKITSAELVSAEGAENPNNFLQRVIGSIRDYKDLPGNTLIVSHAGVGRIIECARVGRSLSEFYDIPEYPNATVVGLDTSWM